jgi:hypothetical protein
MRLAFNRLSNFGRSEDGKLLASFAYEVAKIGGVICLFVGAPYTGAGFMAAGAVADIAKRSAEGERDSLLSNVGQIVWTSTLWGLLIAGVHYSLAKPEPPTQRTTSTQNCLCN